MTSLATRAVIATIIGLSASTQLVFGQTISTTGNTPSTILPERGLIAASAQKVIKALGEKAERMTLEQLRGDFALWKTAAEQNWPEGQYLIGQCYVYGIEVAVDKVKAFSYFQIAADSDWLSACVQVGSCYQNGLGVAKDETAAVKWYRKAAEQGNALGQYCLGQCYQNGIGRRRRRCRSAAGSRSSRGCG